MDALSAGREALSTGNWEGARASFEEALARDESAEAVEALGMAAWWLDDAGLTIESHERAYRLYRQDGDVTGAARMAVWLAWDWPDRAMPRVKLAGQGDCNALPRPVRPTPTRTGGSA